MRTMKLILSLCAAFLMLITAAFGQSEARRYLYLSHPDGAQTEVRSGTGIMIFDVDDGHRLVRRIDIPIFEEGIRGLTGTLNARSVFFSTSNRRLGRFDLETEKIVWEKTYEEGCDRSSITPDGKMEAASPPNRRREVRRSAICSSDRIGPNASISRL